MAVIARQLPLVLVLAAGTLLSQATTARADCAGPTISYPGGEVRRGTTLTVIGTFWGDNCYDTGPPPDGEGTLGLPIEDIEILVSQGDQVVVARGSADADYAFEVNVTIPGSLSPGPVEVIARWDASPAVNATEEPLVISSQPPLTDAQVVATFGPVATPAKNDDTTPWPVVAAAVAAAGVGLAFRARRKSATRRATAA